MKPRPVPIPVRARAGEREPRLPARHRRGAPNDDDQGEPDEPGAASAEAIARPAARDLHREVRGEQRRREEPDRREADAVAMRERASAIAPVFAMFQPVASPRAQPADDRALHASRVGDQAAREQDLALARASARSSSGTGPAELGRAGLDGRPTPGIRHSSPCSTPS